MTAPSRTRPPKRNITDRALDLWPGLFAPPGTQEAVARAIAALDALPTRSDHTSIRSQLAASAAQYLYEKAGGEGLPVQAIIVALIRTKAAAIELAEVIGANRDQLNLAAVRGLGRGQRRLRRRSALEGVERELSDLIELCSWADEVRLKPGRRADNVPRAALSLARLYVHTRNEPWTKNLLQDRGRGGNLEYVFHGNTFVEAALIAFDPQLEPRRIRTVLKNLPLPIPNGDDF